MARREDADYNLMWPSDPAPARGERQPIVASKTLIKRLEGREGHKWRADHTLPSLKGCKRLSIDVETRDEQLSELGPGARRPDCYIVGIGLATDDGMRRYLPYRHGEGKRALDNIDEGIMLRWIKEELDHFDGELIGANLTYDLDFLANDGAHFKQVKKFHDIQVAEPLIDEWRFTYNMDALAVEYLGEGKDEILLAKAANAYGFGQSQKLIKGNLWRLPPEYVGEYAEADVDRPLRIIDLQLKKISEMGLNEVYEVERKLIPMLLAMRRRGVRVDIDRAQQVSKNVAVRLKEVEGELKRLAGKQATFTAGASFAKALVDEGIPVPFTPSSGKLNKYGRTNPDVYSITKPFLAKYQNHPLVKVVLEGRKLETIINTFMNGHILGHYIDHKGDAGTRIHCQFNQLKGDEGGTIARFSSSAPNLQNIPARDPVLAPLIRSIFIPEPGEVWEKLDLSQIEYRLLAHFGRGNGAEAARQKYRDDPKTDFHVMCGDLAGMDAHDEFIRKKIKNVNFCKVYGGGDDKLAETMGVPVEEAAAFSAQYDENLPFVGYTYGRAMHWAEKRGFVETLLGRRQNFPFYEPRRNYGAFKLPPKLYDEAVETYGKDVVRAWIYTALNKKLQGSAADIMKKGMVDQMDAGIFDVVGALLLTVHDEGDYSRAQTKEGEQAMREAKRIMESGFKLTVPVICDRKTGKDWGDCSK